MARSVRGPASRFTRRTLLTGGLEEARHITVYAERRRAYQDIQRILLDDAAAWWYYVKINFEALSARVQGYAQSFTGRRMFLKRAWIA